MLASSSLILSPLATLRRSLLCTTRSPSSLTRYSRHSQGIGIGKRLETLITRAVIPGMQHILSAVDPMEVVLKSKRVQAITNHYEVEIRKVFERFARLDKSLEGRGVNNQGLDTISYSEFIAMLKVTIAW